jgi:hypothetical protein
MTAVWVTNAALIAVNVVLIGFALERRMRGSSAGSSAFWVVLRVAQSLAIVEVVVVAVLYELGDHPRHKLFYLYALLPTAISLVAEDLRAQSLRAVLDGFQIERPDEISALPDADKKAVRAALLGRQFDVTAIAAIVVVFLALRAISTAAGI